MTITTSLPRHRRLGLRVVIGVVYLSLLAGERFAAAFEQRQIPTPVASDTLAAPEPLPATVVPQMVPPASATPEAPSTSREMPLRSITQLSADIRPPAGEVPFNHAAVAFRGEAVGLNSPENLRAGAPFYSTPRAAGFVHRPLYFEQRATERDGRTFGALQPAISGAAFFGTLPVLPYHMAARPQWQRISTGNGVRPTSDRLTPHEHLRGAIGQAAATTGAVFIFP
ncbi:MAG: hypothetical protein JNK76_17340 [Planctomycetales bacterium]|nr:hypothetical protein [Planctomycetales bacterium]MBN8626444.1 hypothetical protein [Planctomycetota bacterium]